MPTKKAAAPGTIAAPLGLDVLDELTGGRLGTSDIPCPLCGPFKRAPANQHRPVLRVWRLDEGFASYYCARCGESGHARSDSAVLPTDPTKLARARAEAVERDHQLANQQHRKALWLWRHRRPIAGSVAETYLREARAYNGPLPETLGFLPARGDYPPAMVAAFGLIEEPEPGIITINDEAVDGIHITKLKVDGSAKADTEPNKIMVGRSIGSPIVLAPVNDLFGLVVCEGIEDALSAYEATGLGAWVAGAASRLPALATAIPAYVEHVHVLVDDDRDGRRHASELAGRIAARGIDVLEINLGSVWSTAA
jgi:hypothetical protein